MTLDEAFKFDEEELRLNKIGRISDAQKRRIQLTSWLPFVVLAVPVIACGILSAIGSQNSENISSSIAVFMGIVLLIVIAMGYINQQNKLKGAEELGVATAFGKISMQDDRRKLLLLEIDGLIFRLYSWQREAFDVEKSYKIYYLKESMEVLSAEIAVKTDQPRKRRKFPGLLPPASED